MIRNIILVLLNISLFLLIISGGLDLMSLIFLTSFLNCEFKGLIFITADIKDCPRASYSLSA